MLYVKMSEAAKGAAQVWTLNSKRWQEKHQTLNDWTQINFCVVFTVYCFLLNAPMMHKKACNNQTLSPSTTALWLIAFWPFVAFGKGNLADRWCIHICKLIMVGDGGEGGGGGRRDSNNLLSDNASLWQDCSWYFELWYFHCVAKTHTSLFLSYWIIF